MLSSPVEVISESLIKGQKMANAKLVHTWLTFFGSLLFSLTSLSAVLYYIVFYVTKKKWVWHVVTQFHLLRMYKRLEHESRPASAGLIWLWDEMALLANLIIYQLLKKIIQSSMNRSWTTLIFPSLKFDGLFLNQVYVGQLWK